jgi:hypothetical protein
VNSLQSVSTAFADAVDVTGTSGVRIAGDEIQPDASWKHDGRANPTVVLEVGCSQDLGPWMKDMSLLNKVSKYLGLQQRQENSGAVDEPFSLSNDVVHAVIVVN